jgi:hypothetical protein
VFLIVGDCLRAASVGEETMPYVTERADRSLGRSFAPSTWTVPSFATLYTGETPLVHDATRRGEVLEPHDPHHAPPAFGAPAPGIDVPDDERVWPIPVREWGHPPGIHTAELPTVPWLECPYGGPAGRRPGEGTGVAAATPWDPGNFVEDRLPVLGYVS